MIGVLDSRTDELGLEHALVKGKCLGDRAQKHKEERVKGKEDAAEQIRDFETRQMRNKQEGKHGKEEDSRDESSRLPDYDHCNDGENEKPLQNTIPRRVKPVSNADA